MSGLMLVSSMLKVVYSGCFIANLKFLLKFVNLSQAFVYPLKSSGNYTQYLIITYNGKEYIYHFLKILKEKILALPVS